MEKENRFTRKLKHQPQEKHVCDGKKMFGQSNTMPKVHVCSNVNTNKHKGKVVHV